MTQQEMQAFNQMKTKLKNILLKPDERVISKAELFAAYTLAAKRHFNPQSEKDHGTLPCLIWQELELLFGAEGE